MSLGGSLALLSLWGKNTNPSWLIRHAHHRDRLRDLLFYRTGGLFGFGTNPMPNVFLGRLQSQLYYWHSHYRPGFLMLTAHTTRQSDASSKTTEIVRLSDTMNDTLITYTLENGLTLLIREIHTAPIVSSWVWYGIGSRNEVPGKTGLSHWVEHMQFKGTAQHSASWMDHSIARLGGHWNAITSPDWTTYFETLPASALETALALEADRMRGSLFEPNEVETERTVILSEREGLENDPLFQLNEAVQLRAFREHPYRNEVIGAKEDLLALTREDLYGHYRNYYQPANALLCLAGDVDPQQALALTRQYFGNIESLPLEKQLPRRKKTRPRSNR